MAVRRKFYVYEFRDPSGHTFYVGKGKWNKAPSRNRLTRHRYETLTDDNKHLKLYRKIRKLWRDGFDYTEHVVFTTDNEARAFMEERRRIALYGRSNLCNLSDGGDGLSGYRHTKASRLKMSQKLKGRKWSPERKAAKSLAYAGKFCGQRIYKGAEHWTHRRPELLRRGGRCYQAKVTWAIVRCIRREYIPRVVPLRVFVDRYDLKKSAVHKIVTYQTWIPNRMRSQ